MAVGVPVGEGEMMGEAGGAVGSLDGEGDSLAGADGDGGVDGEPLGGAVGDVVEQAATSRSSVDRSRPERRTCWSLIGVVSIDVRSAHCAPRHRSRRDARRAGARQMSCSVTCRGDVRSTLHYDYHRRMPTVRVVDTTSVSADRVLEAARDFSPRRADRWPDVHLEHLQVHDRGPTFADVTEGNPWPIGYVWERLRYDWSEPGRLKAVVVASNLFRPGSTWEISATSQPGGGSRVELVAVRRLRGRGLLLFPVFPLGLARQSVAEDLRHFLATLEDETRAERSP
jgi:hypothetical protein